MDYCYRICTLLLLVYLVYAVDKNNFKTCEQSSFCRRLRRIEPHKSTYNLDVDSLQTNEHTVTCGLINSQTGDKLQLTLTALLSNTFRLLVDEVEPLHPRYCVDVALDPREPQVGHLEVLDRNKEAVFVRSGNNKVILHVAPFKVDFFQAGRLVASVNSRGRFEFESLRPKKSDQEDNNGEGTADENDNINKEDPGAWEENFRSHQDSKPRGPEAIALDISFPGAQRAYGIPEHADRFALRTTEGLGSNVDPYRLYNLDVFEYDLDSQMALYGSVPVLYAHAISEEGKDSHTVGMFWNNAAEMWVDIRNSHDGGHVMSSLVNLVSGGTREDRVDVHWMSESGIVDLFVLLGPTPKEAVRQYAALTGVAPLPPYFALGYHQCRWNYVDQDDVASVVQRFDEHDLPMDVMWLDIEYTDAKKYFTWDAIKFPQPGAMVANLTATGRKLVVIVDPHVKREGGYFLHEDALERGYYVKNREGGVYEGWCWPGSSSYPDFLDPEVRDYYGGLYALDKFPGTSEDVHIWNDMNEPSVFNGPEITMPKDLVHYGGWEHRHVHNVYGLYYSIVTHGGLLARTPNRRPFVLTRAHFAGSQRYAAVWTGDNAAEWAHLAASVPMCLSEAMAGISLCGADIGGFFNNPDVELLQRWYQLGAWLPFYRSHAHIDTKRREPYLYDQDVRIRIRNALRQRYAHLPLWYTLFYEHERLGGDPVMRSLMYEWPLDERLLDVDDQFMVGGIVMVKAIATSGATTAQVLFPGGATETWYDTEDYRPFSGAAPTAVVTLPTCIDKMPVWYRGGSIIPRRDRPRRSSVLTHSDPYTLYIALSGNGTAHGSLYMDDGLSYDYRSSSTLSSHLYVRFTFSNLVLTCEPIDGTFSQGDVWVERVVVLGPPLALTYARVEGGGGSERARKLHVTYDGENRSLTIRKPAVALHLPFKIALH